MLEIASMSKGPTSHSTYHHNQQQLAERRTPHLLHLLGINNNHDINNNNNPEAVPLPHSSRASHVKQPALSR